MTTKIHGVGFTCSLLMATAVAPTCAVEMRRNARSIRNASHRTLLLRLFRTVITTAFDRHLTVV